MESWWRVSPRGRRVSLDGDDAVELRQVERSHISRLVARCVDFKRLFEDENCVMCFVRALRSYSCGFKSEHVPVERRPKYSANTLRQVLPVQTNKIFTVSSHSA